jgi:cellobiose-specific phosphotransferase system component IIB
VSAGLMPFFGYLDRCTSPADQLIVTSDYADILVLAGRGFASDGVTFGVWYSSVAHQARTIEDMRARPALFTILIGEPQLRARYPQVADYVAMDFKPMADIDIEQFGRVPLLVHRDRPSSSIDRETGWPCFR